MTCKVEKHKIVLVWPVENAFLQGSIDGLKRSGFTEQKFAVVICEAELGELDIHSTSVIYGMTQRTQASTGRIHVDADAYGVAVLCVRRFHHKPCFTRSSGCEGSLSCMCIPPIICSSVAGECETSVAMSWIPCQ